MNMLPSVVTTFVNRCVDPEKPYFDWDYAKINKELENGILERGKNLITEDMCEGFDIEDFNEKVLELAKERYQNRMQEAGKLGIDFEKIEKFVLLKVVDSNWMNHIDDMQIMKNEIFARGFGNQDPVLAYKKDGYELFEKMISQIRETVCLILLSIKMQVEKKPEKVQRPTFTPIARKEELPSNKPKSEKPKVQMTVVNETPKVGRNELCPCGSGKKYKNCCGKNV